MKWSSLYPRKWRAEFGDEFDAMLEGRELAVGEALDIVFHAGLERARNAMGSLPFVTAWATVCFLNIVAKEVQWPAGALLLFTGVATAWRPKNWLKNPIVFAISIPISSLYFYQIPGIHHEPLYKTAVAFLPALFGSLLGLGFGLAIREVSGPSPNELT